MKKAEQIPSEIVEKVLEHLESSGESIEELESDGWELLGFEPVEDLDDSKFELSISAKPTDKSTHDKGLYKILYEYTSGDGRDIISTSRDFCRRIINYQKRTARRFRKEDIDQMSFSNENGEFGTYSIFKFKGSYGCRHYWKRLIYFRKRKDGKFLPPSKDPSKPLNDQNDKRVGDTPSVRRAGDEAKVNPKPNR